MDDLTTVWNDLISSIDELRITQLDLLREWDRAYYDCTEPTHAARTRYADHHCLPYLSDELEHKSRIEQLRERRDLLLYLATLTNA